MPTTSKYLKPLPLPNSHHMSTALFKKLFLCWFILVGLWGFGFTQYPVNKNQKVWYNNGCRVDDDCKMKEVQSCCWVWNSYQCSNKNNPSHYNPICAFVECSINQKSTKRNKIIKPNKYNIIYDCGCKQYQCQSHQTGQEINPIWIKYIIMRTWTVSLLLIVLWFGWYFVYNKLKKTKTPLSISNT